MDTYHKDTNFPRETAVAAHLAAVTAVSLRGDQITVPGLYRYKRDDQPWSFAKVCLLPGPDGYLLFCPMSEFAFHAPAWHDPATSKGWFVGPIPPEPPYTSEPFEGREEFVKYWADQIADALEDGRSDEPGVPGDYDFEKVAGAIYDNDVAPLLPVPGFAARRGEPVTDSRI